MSEVPLCCPLNRNFRGMIRRFDESYDDNTSGGYRDLSLNIEVLLLLLLLYSRYRS